MQSNFIVTGIERIILVDKDEYREVKTQFFSDLSSNELIFHFSGTSTVKFNGKTFFCDENTIRFLPKGKNTEYIVERSDYGDCIDIFFQTDVPISDEAFCFKAKNSKLVRTLFKKVFSVWVGKNEGYYFECISILYKILSEMQKQNYISGEQQKRIAPAVKYIEEHFLIDKISVEFLSRLCGISDSYLKKLFIKNFGISPIKYIIQMKMNYASDLLRSNLYSLEQVSEMCNYENYYYFSRQFKKYVGTSPYKFVKEYKSSK